MMIRILRRTLSVLAGAAVFASLAVPALAQSDYEKGVEARKNRDFLGAAKAFRAGVAKGDKQAPNALGELYILGLGVDRDAELGCRLFAKGAERGDPAAEHNYGVCLEKGKAGKPDPAGAFKWYSKSVAANHTAAFCALGELYITGLGTAKDEKRGFDLCLKGAQTGDTKAAARVGELYFTGTGTKRDVAEAYKWLKQAGDKQDPSAAYNLGLMHLNGDGVPKSLEKARRWFTVSALRHHRIAYVPAATLYRNKVIELLDKEKIDLRTTRWAIFFLNLAKSVQTSDETRKHYDTLIDQFTQLSPKAREQADRDLVKWKAGNL
jgi:TPR repeat protein